MWIFLVGLFCFLSLGLTRPPESHSGIMGGSGGAGVSSSAHDTDCPAAVTGTLGAFCTDLDDGRLWGCQNPSSGGVSSTLCDTASDWVLNSTSTAGAVTTFESRTGPVVSAPDDYEATEITNTPAGAIAGTTVQAAIIEIDTEKQPLDDELTAVADLTSAADRLAYYTGLGTAALATFTPAGRALVGDADAAAQRATLGLGTLATQNGTSSGDNTGDQDLSALAPKASPTFTGTVTVPMNFKLGATTVVSSGNELNFVDGVTSAIQAQIDGKVSLASPTFTGTVTVPTPFVLGAVSVLSSGAELNFVDGVTSPIQSQIDTLNSGKQPLDTELTAVAGLTSAADRLPYYTGLGTAALATFTATGRALIDDADVTAQRATLGLGTLATQDGTFSGTSSGTNTGDQDLSALQTQIDTLDDDKQPLDTELTAVAGLTSAADRLTYYTGLGTAALATFTAAGRALVDDADATAQRATLALGTLATQNGTFSGSSSGTNTGDQTTITGNAGTSTALAGDPANCDSNSLARGINASGVATPCVDVLTNDAVVNEAGDPLSWSKIKDIPAGFADGADDGAGGTTSNSFETQNAPAGTDPVASSATDTLNWVATAPATITGDSTTDTLTVAVSDASTTAKGVVELATDGENAASVAVQGNDARLSNTRTPTAHATTHQNGGADEVGTATPGANAIPKAGAGSTLGDGWLASTITRDAELDTFAEWVTFTGVTGTCDNTTVVRGDGVCAPPTEGGGGDVSSNTASSVDSEVALFETTSGKTIKRATGTGIGRLASGVLSAAELSGDVVTSGSNVATIQANSVALATDTVGNYVADVVGTANEIAVQHTPGENSTATFSLPTGIAATKIGGGGVSTAEFDFLGTLTANVQTQIDAKSPLASPTFTGSVTMPTPFTLGAVSVLPTGTELNFVDGVTSSIQTQFTGKASTVSPTFTGTVVLPTPFTVGAVSVLPTGTELNFVGGVTSAIQAQIDGKASTVSPTFTGTVAMSTPFTLGGVSVLPTGTELNFVDGVTSAIQTQINTKSPLASPIFTGSVTMPAPFTLGATSVLPTGAELNFVDGVTSAIQTQIDGKASLTSPAFTGTVTLPTPFTLGAVSVLPNGTELNFVDGVTSAIQTQFTAKAPLASPTFTGTVTLPTPFTLGAVSVLPTGTELNFVDGVTSAIQTQINTHAALTNPHGATTAPTANTIKLRDALGGERVKFTRDTVATLPACDATSAYTETVFVEGANATDCGDTGGGTFGNDCYCNGTSWAVKASGGGGSTLQAAYNLETTPTITSNANGLLFSGFNSFAKSNQLCNDGDVQCKYEWIDQSGKYFENFKLPVSIVTKTYAGESWELVSSAGVSMLKITDAGVVSGSVQFLQECKRFSNTVSTDDNILFMSFQQAVTIKQVWCNYEGATPPTTVATFALEDGAGNAMTHTAPTCTAPGTPATAQAITAAGSLTAREVLRFDVPNTPNPTSDEHLLCVSYVLD